MRWMLAILVVAVPARAFAGLGPFDVRSNDGSGWVSRRVFVTAAGELVDSGGALVGRIVPIASAPLPCATFELDAAGSVVWDGEGSTGVVPLGSTSVELVRPSVLKGYEFQDGVIWLLAITLGASLWCVIRDSYWRRSESL